MRPTLIRTGALLLLLAVAAGAFGAHGLRARLTPEALDQWRTAVEYQFYHGLGLLLVAALSSYLPLERARWVLRLFSVGVVLFSGSIYLLSTRDLTGLHAAGAVLGPITPIGGLALMAGWGLLLISAGKGTDQR
ncbi:MAG: DUF423 domain-containing protein [Flavobacteriales bacterium]|jgi:uncharacterized membrane protein YgdD (TMEM256/DUF423 family)|nr:DUF423 domain-containing protein [Flavobacteriales bacterium]